MAFSFDYDPLTGVPFMRGAPAAPEPARIAPTQSAAVTPNTAATTPSTPARPRPAPAQQNESPEMANALEQFQAAYRERLAAAQPQGQGQLSVLDMLRKRMSRDMENEGLQRASEFGAGMLASGSPNFFTMLGAGARAAREGDAARMDQLRRLADAERQAAEQRSQEEYRRQQIEVERERRDIERRRVEAEIANQGAVAGVQMIDDNGRVVLVNPRTGATIRETGYRSPQELRSARPLTEAARAQIWSRVGREADTLAGIVEGVTPTQAQITNRDSIRRELFRQALEVAAQSGGMPEASSSGTGTPGQQRPSQTLQYPRPQQ